MLNVIKNPETSQLIELAEYFDNEAICIGDILILDPGVEELIKSKLLLYLEWLDKPRVIARVTETKISFNNGGVFTIAEFIIFHKYIKIIKASDVMGGNSNKISGLKPLAISSPCQYKKTIICHKFNDGDIISYYRTEGNINPTSTFTGVVLIKDPTSITVKAFSRDGNVSRYTHDITTFDIRHQHVKIEEWIKIGGR